MADPENKGATQLYDDGKKSSEQWLQGLGSNPKGPVEEHTAAVRSEQQ
jgi:hypothetical protein